MCLALYSVTAAAEAVRQLAAGFVARLPLIVLALVVLVLGLVAVRFAVRWTERGCARAGRRHRPAAGREPAAGGADHRCRLLALSIMGVRSGRRWRASGSPGWRWPSRCRTSSRTSSPAC
jgi:hypothetical protein